MKKEYKSPKWQLPVRVSLMVLALMVTTGLGWIHLRENGLIAGDLMTWTAVSLLLITGFGLITFGDRGW